MKKQVFDCGGIEIAVYDHPELGKSMVARDFVDLMGYKKPDREDPSCVNSLLPPSVREAIKDKFVLCSLPSRNGHGLFQQILLSFEGCVTIVLRTNRSSFSDSTKMSLLRAMDKGPSEFLKQCRLAGQEYRRRKQSWVYSIYALAAENGLVKIGYAKDLKKRVRAIALQSPLKLELIAEGKTISPQKMEKILHKRFSEHRSHGEWFRISEKQAKDAFRELFSTEVLQVSSSQLTSIEPFEVKRVEIDEQMTLGFELG